MEVLDLQTPKKGETLHKMQYLAKLMKNKEQKSDTKAVHMCINRHKKRIGVLFSQKVVKTVPIPD